MTELVYTDTPCKRGHRSPRYAKFGRCVECVREENARNIKRKVESGENAKYLRGWYAKNKQYAASKRRQWSLNNPERTMLSSARRAARAKGIPFNIDLSNIAIPIRCPVLGIPLIRGDGFRKDNSPSLDRIVPGLGYIKGNVVVISYRANRIKNDATLEELQLVASFYKKFIT